LRKTSPGPGPDRFLAPDMQAAVDVVANGTLAKLVR
jgi:hypothetical protein